MNAMLTISRNPESVIPNMGERLIIVRFKNPDRTAAITIPADPWNAMRADVPAAYASLFDAVLEKAAKDILSAALSGFSTWPTEIDAMRFTFDALMEQASGSNSGWLSKEELAAAWRLYVCRNSATILCMESVMNEIQLRELFELARHEGLARYAGDERMESKLRLAGTVGHKAYLRILPEFQPGKGCLVTLAFRRPKKWGYEAHSVALVKDAPIGAWAVTDLAVTPVSF